MRKAARFGSPDVWLLGVVLAFVAIGVLLVFDASYKKAVEASWAGHDAWFFAKRQIAFAAAGLIGLMLASSLRLTTFLRLTGPLLIAAILLLAGLFAFGEARNGAVRWYRIGPVSFQPAEFAKIALVMYLAALLAQRKKQVRRLSTRWVIPVAIVGLIAGLILIEPDLGTTVAVVGVSFAMFFAAGALKRHLLAGGLIGGGLATVAVLSSPERIERIRTWLDPWRDRYGEGYQIIHSLIAHGTGGWLGVGFCEGREKAYLPAASTDFVFSTIAEEAGLIGGLVVIALFLLLIYRGLDIARRAQSTYASLLASGMTCMIGLQALVNIAVASSSIPATGVPLPFLSYGGSSMVCMLVAVGVILAVSRQIDVSLDDEELYENSFGGWRNGRTYISRHQHSPRPSRGSAGRGTPLYR